jgi:glutaredoxin-related protein
MKYFCSIKHGRENKYHRGEMKLFSKVMEEALSLHNVLSNKDVRNRIQSFRNKWKTRYFCRGDFKSTGMNENISTSIKQQSFIKS